MCESLVDPLSLHALPTNFFEGAVTVVKEWILSGRFLVHVLQGDVCKIVCKIFVKNWQRSLFQDVSLYFKLVIDDFPCYLLDSCSRYLPSISLDLNSEHARVCL